MWKSACSRLNQKDYNYFTKAENSVPEILRSDQNVKWLIDWKIDKCSLGDTLTERLDILTNICLEVKETVKGDQKL